MDSLSDLHYWIVTKPHHAFSFIIYYVSGIDIGVLSVDFG